MGGIRSYPLGVCVFPPLLDRRTGEMLTKQQRAEVTGAVFGSTPPGYSVTDEVGANAD
jgi:hypothetical protein